MNIKTHKTAMLLEEVRVDNQGLEKRVTAPPTLLSTRIAMLILELIGPQSIEA